MKLTIALLFLVLQSMAYAQECVVLLHGLGRSTWSMRLMANTLEKQKYLVINQNYLSREKSIPELAQIVGETLQRCEKLQPTAIHFVTHSLGGILVRAYFHQHPAIGWRRTGGIPAARTPQNGFRDTPGPLYQHRGICHSIRDQALQPQ